MCYIISFPHPTVVLELEYPLFPAIPANEHVGCDDDSYGHKTARKNLSDKTKEKQNKTTQTRLVCPQNWTSNNNLPIFTIKLFQLFQISRKTALD